MKEIKIKDSGGFKYPSINDSGMFLYTKHLRKVEYKWDGKYYDGYFHEWINIKEHEDGLFVMGIIEDCKSGSCNTVYIEDIKFIDHE